MSDIEDLEEIQDIEEKAREAYQEALDEGRTTREAALYSRRVKYRLMRELQKTLENKGNDVRDEIRSKLDDAGEEKVELPDGSVQITESSKTYIRNKDDLREVINKSEDYEVDDFFNKTEYDYVEVH